MTSKQAGVILHHIRRLAAAPAVAQPPDAQLLERFTAHRDEAAFTTLVRRHGPLVLCYLEGRSQEEAANQLGWSKGALRGRLDRGREHLRRRLAGRGVALSALLCATAVAPTAAADALVDAVVRSAVDGVGGSV